jgi:branched-chain amino acid transport system permease protein
MRMDGTRHPRAYLLAAFAAAGALQLVAGRLDDYFLHVLLAAAVNVTLAVSLNLINGHTGQFSLGHAGFMAVGAYASAAVTTLWPAADPGLLAGAGPLFTQGLFLLALLAGGAAAALCGLLVGIPSLRLRGDYLAIVTLGFGEIIRVVLQSTETLGGATGLPGLPRWSSPAWCVGVAALSIYVVGCVVRSTYGSGYLATRDDEIAAESCGVDTTRCKVNAFVVGAFFAGVAGGLYAHLICYINPSGFGFLKSVEIVAMVILGGMGSTPGVALAAVALTVLLESLRGLGAYRMVLYALIIIGFMLLRPQGILGPGGPRTRGGGR